MATYTLKEAPKVWNRRKKGIRQASKSSTEDAAIFALNEAGMRAPRGETLQTVNGLRMYPIKDGHCVESFVPGKFKQNFWANVTPHYEGVKLRWRGFKKTRYGDGPANWTGIPQFFDIAATLTQEKYPKLMVTRIDKVMKGS